MGPRCYRNLWPNHVNYFRGHSGNTGAFLRQIWKLFNITVNVESSVSWDELCSLAVSLLSSVALCLTIYLGLFASDNINPKPRVSLRVDQTKKIADKATEIMKTGASGSYVNEFEAMEKKLTEVKQHLQNTSASSQQLQELEKRIASIR